MKLYSDKNLLHLSLHINDTAIRIAIVQSLVTGFVFAAELKRIAYAEYEHLSRFFYKSFRTERRYLTDTFFSHLIIIGERKQNTNPCLKVLLGIHRHKCGLILILLDGFTKEVILHFPELPEQ